MTDQIVMHLRYAPGKILSSTKWGRTSPEGQSLVAKRPKKVIPPQKNVCKHSAFRARHEVPSKNNGRKLEREQ